MKSNLIHEVKNLLAGFTASVMLFFLLFIWRLYSTRIFLFIQILLCTVFIYLVLIYFSRSKLTFFYRRELVSTLIAFLICSFLLLNIDRSRSIYILKWVSIYQGNDFVSVDQISKNLEFSTSETEALKQRAGEQKQTLMMTSKGSGLRLTSMGEFFIKICSALARLFNLNGYLKA